ncbi:hypothetical protein WA026_014427 [Henosepilachna vigintioctopunctata]|uniref:Uncharacterized protein n=1 Tax=Henosepilachna vigintioctopunctata TaxID=420089 RepID=A0AAW1UIN3_9CUCU
MKHTFLRLNPGEKRLQRTPDSARSRNGLRFSRSSRGAKPAWANDGTTLDHLLPAASSPLIFALETPELLPLFCGECRKEGPIDRTSAILRTR